jgi:hypothetical protein
MTGKRKTVSPTDNRLKNKQAKTSSSKSPSPTKKIISRHGEIISPINLHKINPKTPENDSSI